MNDSEKLAAIRAIIAKYHINSGETLWQSGSVAEDVMEILESICDIVGYADEGE